MTSSIERGLLVAGYSIDGEPIGVEFCASTALSAKWLQICSDFLAAHGSTFDDSWGRELSDYRIKFTSASGAAIVTFYVHNDIALSLLLMSGISLTADRELAAMFVESLAGSELVKAARATQHPFSGVMSHNERPLVVMVPWANAAISEQEYDVVGDLSLHLSGAFFSNCINDCQIRSVQLQSWHRGDPADVTRILRMELLDKPEFWAAHMWPVTRGPVASADPDIAEAAFGLSQDSIEAFYLLELANEVEWPYFRVSLPRGYSVEIEYANEPEDYEIVYRLCNTNWPSPICVAKGGGHWLLPAFRWTELLELSRAAAQPECALLLLLPTTWLTPDDNLEEARRQLVEAWERLDVVPRLQIPLLIEQLIASSQNDVRWRCDPRLGWVNDSAHSRRNPDNPACLNEQEFSALKEFLMACAGGVRRGCEDMTVIQ